MSSTGRGIDYVGFIMMVLVDVFPMGVAVVEFNPRSRWSPIGDRTAVVALEWISPLLETGVNDCNSFSFLTVKSNRKTKAELT